MDVSGRLIPSGGPITGSTSPNSEFDRKEAVIVDYLPLCMQDSKVKRPDDECIEDVITNEDSVHPRLGSYDTVDCHNIEVVVNFVYFKLLSIPATMISPGIQRKNTLGLIRNLRVNSSLDVQTRTEL